MKSRSIRSWRSPTPFEVANLLWCGVLLYFYVAAPGMQREGVSILSVAVVLYSVLSAAIVLKSRIALVSVLLLLIPTALCDIVFVLVNMAMWATGAELYVDSPMTAYVVVVHAAIVTFPASILLVLLWLARNAVFERVLQRNAA